MERRITVSINEKILEQVIYSYIEHITDDGRSEMQIIMNRNGSKCLIKWKE